MAEMYNVRCTECGEVLKEKFFPLGDLLKEYYIGDFYKPQVKDLVDFLGIGAKFGKPILPKVPPFKDAKGAWNFAQPNPTGTDLWAFECADIDIPKGDLMPIYLNIASIVAQFAWTTGFMNIYPMLRLRQQLDAAAAKFADPTPEQTTQWGTYCDELMRLPGVKVDPLLAKEVQYAEIAGYMTNILAFADIESKIPQRCHFANQGFCAGWRYKTENRRRMPYSLVVRGNLAGIFDAQECCCGSCHRAVPWELGAYEQRVIGILGTQQVGKTSYLMALADAIPKIPLKKGMSITYDPSDPQWKRVTDEGGLLWKYQNGFIPGKTEVELLKAPALTFKVKKDIDSEAIMYTLADIPGEAFQKDAKHWFPPEMIEEIERLLKASHALMVVIKHDQLQDTNANPKDQPEETPAAAEQQSKLEKNPMKILGSCKDFLSPDPISTAVILSAADKLGDRRTDLELAFDIRDLPPLLDSAEQNLYNQEAMDAVSEAVSRYLDNKFKNFMSGLRSAFLPKGSPAAAFAVSSGTQFGIEASTENASPSKARYKQMHDARFGVEAPLLWLLARDGVLDTSKIASRAQKKGHTWSKKASGLVDKVKKIDLPGALKNITRKEP